MNRLLYDIRSASSTDATSVWGSNPGTLVLHNYDSSGNATTTTYTATGGMVRVAQGTGSAQPLLPSDVDVSNFTLYHITTTQSEAVRWILTLRAATTTKQVSATFYGTAVLRGSY
jgi:hypothetical protein